jgi:hypothetical protein
LIVIGAFVALDSGHSANQTFAFNANNQRHFAAVFARRHRFAVIEPRKLWANTPTGLYFKIFAWFITIVISLLSLLLIGKTIVDMF